MMQLFVMRHGEANAMAPTDSMRSLTQWGVTQSQRAGRWFQQRQLAFDLVMVSPYLRAQQTWEGVVSQLDFNGLVITEEALQPAGHAELVLMSLDRYNDIQPKNILMVSHLPLVGYLVHHLCNQVRAPMFSTAAVAELQLNDTFGAATYYGMHHPSAD